MSTDLDTTASRSRSSLVLGFLIVIALVVLDQWSKAEIYTWLISGQVSGLVRDIHGHERFLISGEWLAWMPSCNPGAAFGQFGQFPVVLVVGRILACGFLTFLLVKERAGPRAVHWAMLLVLSGALGNVIDNLGAGCGSQSFPYGVRDFVAVWFEPLVGWDYHFPSFNVADACISIGAVLWIGSGLFGPRAEAEQAADSARVAAGAPHAGDQKGES